VIGSVERQLDQLPPEASHLVISVGGNDALGHAGVLDETTRSMADALERLSGIRDQFAQEYAAMLEGVLERGLPTSVCTIYDPRFPDPLRRRLAAIGLTIFNDCITREAFSRALPLMDLRLICDEDEDFANPIEPSVRGGAKIAAADAGRERALAVLPRHGAIGGAEAAQTVGAFPAEQAADDERLPRCQREGLPGPLSLGVAQEAEELDRVPGRPVIEAQPSRARSGKVGEMTLAGETHQAVGEDPSFGHGSRVSRNRVRSGRSSHGS
jgi:hypothetical protein